MKFGWRRDQLDHRDLRYSAPKFIAADLPRKIDWRSKLPPVWEQDNLGSCVAQSLASILYYLQTTNRKKVFQPSRLAIYYNARVLEDTVDYDSGVSMRNGIKAVAKWGFCDENLWPYDIEKFRRKPNKKVFKASSNNKIITYEKLNNNLISLKSCLVEGNLFAFGFSVYESFKSQLLKNYEMPIPASDEVVYGGHAVCCCGYDDDMQKFIIRNSWGDNWCDKGYFLMPYSFITNSLYCDDFWTVKTIN